MVSFWPYKCTTIPMPQCQRITLNRNIIINSTEGQHQQVAPSYDNCCVCLTDATIWRSKPTSKDVLVRLAPDKNTYHRYDRKQQGFGGQSKPILRKKAKTTKKLVLRMECTVCKWKNQVRVESSSWKQFSINLSGADQEDEALWAGRGEEAQGADDPVLAPASCSVTKQGSEEVLLMRKLNFS